MSIAVALAALITACDGEEQRRGTPDQSGQEGASTEGKIRPDVDGSEATGQSPNDTISKGDDGATSY